MDRETGAYPGRTIDKSSISETSAQGGTTPAVFKASDFNLTLLDGAPLVVERTPIEPPSRLERFTQWATKPWVRASAGVLASGAALTPAIVAAHTEYAQVAGVNTNSPYVLEGLQRDEQRIENRQPLSDSDTQLRSNLATALTGGAPVEIAEPNGNSRFVAEYMPGPDIFEVTIQSSNVDQAKQDGLNYFKAQGVSNVCAFPVVFSLAPEVAASMVSLGQQFDPSIAECQQDEASSALTTETAGTTEVNPAKQITKFSQILENSGVNLDDRDKEILNGPLSSEIGKEPTVDLTATSSFRSFKNIPEANVKIYNYFKDGYGQFSIVLDHDKVVYMDVPFGMLSRSQDPFTIVKAEINMGVNPSEAPFQTNDGEEAYAWPEKGLIVLSAPTTNPGVGDLVDRVILINPMSTSFFDGSLKTNLALHGIPNTN